MRDGATRVDVPYLWPSTLRAPLRPPKLVYLDLLHWIRLAKAMTGHADGKSATEVLEVCIRAREEGQALFPIADAIYIEVSKIKQHRQRRDIRLAIEALSGYFVVTSRPTIANHEIEAVLDRVIGPSPDPVNTMDYLDWGVARAFGRVGGFRVRRDTGEDITDEVRDRFPQGPDAFDATLAAAELELQRRTLEGPSSQDEEEALRAYGWRPSGGMEISANRARQEVEQVGRFNSDPRWRAGRIRDVVAAREVLIEINEMLFRGLSDRGATIGDVFDSPAVTRGQLDVMPSFDVAVSLKTEYHRDPHHRWTTNDIHDIDALASTLPYCDIVVTDKAAAAAVNRCGLAARLDTVVLARLEDLCEHLS
jgi:hypothetical protein